MFVITLHYDAPLPVIDGLMEQHVTFLEECFRSGLFLAAGRQIPRTGGVILARGVERDRLEEVMQLDPFIREGAARFEVIEFRTSLHHPSLSAFADPGTREISGPEAPRS